MAKLNQIIAIEKGIKARCLSKLTEANRLVQKPDLFNGFNKEYQPMKEDGEKFPPEIKKVQFDAEELLVNTTNSMTELIDIIARKDYTNCVSSADVVVDGVVIIPKAPVSFLLFMEKQLEDYQTLVQNMPTLDDNETWVLDNNSQLNKTEATMTHKTKKVQKPIVLYDATPVHPAQTQLITEDETIGHWKQIKMSSAMTKRKKKDLVDRAIMLKKAVMQAREAANMIDEVPDAARASAVVNFLLNKPAPIAAASSKGSATP